MNPRWSTGWLAVVIFMLLASATAVRAQPPASSRILTGYAGLSIGSSTPPVASFTTTSSYPGQWSFGIGLTSQTYQLGPRLQLDVSGGAVIARHFVGGVSYTYFTISRPAEVGLMLTAPTYKGGLTVNVTDATDPLARSESALHISGGYQGAFGSFEWQGFAGPSRFRLRQQVTTPSYFIPDLPDDPWAPVHLEGAFPSWTTGTAWGFHVGGELRYFFSRVIGVGVTVRYSRATVTVPYPPPLAPAGSIENRLGGVDVVGGLRWRF